MCIGFPCQAATLQLRHQQRAHRGEVGHHRNGLADHEPAAAAGRLEAIFQHVGDLRSDLGRVFGRGFKGDEPDAVGEVGGGFPGDFDCQSGLADAARPAQGYGPGLRHQPEQLGAFALTSDEAVGCLGQVGANRCYLTPLRKLPSSLGRTARSCAGSGPERYTVIYTLLPTWPGDPAH